MSEIIASKDMSDACNCSQCNRNPCMCNKPKREDFGTFLPLVVIPAYLGGVFALCAGALFVASKFASSEVSVATSAVTP